MLVLLILSFWNRLQGAVETSNVFFFYGLIAFFLGLASVIYMIKQWSFGKQIIAHYLVMLVTIFPTLLLSGFYPLNSFDDLLKVYIQFNKVGLILFLLTYFISKSRQKYNNGRVVS
ncbi:DUF3021 domain-containing protein [Mesobacillus maritimus]|uniref:DUF3021 family protein n=1 Tax=Mesobacillus maritimus TaxID=1643336 RepID=UPI00204121B2|nr:DUF3021 family protein [Mesobacillus maritimus]MCM3671855.1 DUF3021 domain-containing protein [Mesobacillus maritimus]